MEQEDGDARVCVICGEKEKAGQAFEFSLLQQKHHYFGKLITSSKVIPRELGPKICLPMQTSPSSAKDITYTQSGKNFRGQFSPHVVMEFIMSVSKEGGSH